MFQVSLPAVHLPRFSCESVPGVSSRFPPGTVFPRKRVRCLIPPSTWHGIPAKAFHVSHPASHLLRFSCKSVPGVLSRCPPGTEFPRKCSRCLILPPTWHGIPAKACQVYLPALHLARNLCESVSGVTFRLPPGTESPQKRSRCPFPPSTCHGFPTKACQVSLPAAHLPRYPRKSVPGVPSRCPPATVSPQKRVRCLILPPTWHGIPAKSFQVAPLAAHLAQYSRESVPGSLFRLPPGTEILRKCSRCLILPPTWHGIPAKVFQVAPLAAHLPRYPRKSVSGVPSRRSPGTEIPRKCSRCPFPPPTWHGNPAKVFQVSFPASHLARNRHKFIL